MMKLLVFGKTGQVATEIGRRVPVDMEVIALGRDEADLADPEACAEAIHVNAPDAVINAAAYTSVDKAETETALADLVNGAAPGAMARAAAADKRLLAGVCQDEYHFFQYAGPMAGFPSVEELRRFDEAEILRRFLRYRTYHGCAMPNHHQVASIAAWNDEEHVRANRALYASKFDAVLDILGEPLKVSAPDAGFYLWPKTPVDDETFARRLKSEENVTVLPGRYLSRTVQGRNPGKNRVRMALVAELDQCVEGAKRIRALIERL